MDRVARLEGGPEPASIQLETEVESNRVDRRSVAGAEADPAAKLREVQVRGAGKLVPAVNEQHAADIAENRHSQFRVEDDLGVADVREPRRGQRVGRADGI